MSPMWVLVRDTYRQSRRQAVFIIMIVLMALIAIGYTALLGSTTDELGRTRTKLSFQDEPAVALEKSWVNTNTGLRLQQGEVELDLADAKQTKEVVERATKETAELAKNTPLVRQGVEAWIYSFANLAFSLSIILFIAGAAGYFPNMLEAGGVDILLAKPLDRLRIFLGKYLGGLALYATVVFGAYLIVFVGMGIRTGVWHSRIFLAMPLQLFSAALLFAILACVGIVSRRATLSMVVGLVFYIVIDSVVAALLGANRVGLFSGLPVLEKVADALELTLPNFGLLKQASCASVLSLPSLDAKPLAVAAAWLAGSLGLGYWRFNRTDY